jgi:hypothetical protein
MYGACASIACLLSYVLIKPSNDFNLRLYAAEGIVFQKFKSNSYLRADQGIAEDRWDATKKLFMDPTKGISLSMKPYRKDVRSQTCLLAPHERIA